MKTQKQIVITAVLGSAARNGTNIIPKRSSRFTDRTGARFKPLCLGCHDDLMACKEFGSTEVLHSFTMFHQPVPISALLQPEKNTTCRQHLPSCFSLPFPSLVQNVQCAQQVQLPSPGLNANFCSCSVCLSWDPVILQLHASISIQSRFHRDHHRHVIALNEVLTSQKQTSK